MGSIVNSLSWVITAVFPSSTAYEEITTKRPSRRGVVLACKQKIAFVPVAP